jgi:hypothetical protein
LINKIAAFTICPTAIWATDATTVAGSRMGLSGASATRLYAPITVIVDNTNAIYVSDYGNFRVQRFSSNSTEGITVINATFGTGLNQFASSKHNVHTMIFFCLCFFSLSFLVDSMSMDNNGNIYILDGLLARVTKWAPGATTGILVAGGSDFANYYDYYYGTDKAASESLYYYQDYFYFEFGLEPSGIFLELETMIIWLADTYNSQIVKWTNSSTRIVVYGSYGSELNQFANPLGLFIDTNAGNTLYVADTGNHRIQMWPPGATSGVTVAGLTNYYGNGLNQLRYPQALIVDTNMNMFIVDYGNDRIMKWMVGASSGVVIAGSNTYGTLANQFVFPSSISFDSDGSLFVCDVGNNRIQNFAISCCEDYPFLLISCP